MKNWLSFFPWALILALLGAGCASPPPALESVDITTASSGDERAVYRRLYAAARQWQQQAAAVDGEWRDIAILLEQAQQAATAGEYQRAIELAEYARFQGEMGYRQMREQQQIVHPPFLR
jgi:ABC-type glycerol-3-phosphate transport system substrate-binding protein